MRREVEVDDEVVVEVGVGVVRGRELGCRDKGVTDSGMYSVGGYPTRLKECRLVL
jgi:hypothetical protein